jgi:hypothetical protein
MSSSSTSRRRAQWHEVSVTLPSERRVVDTMSRSGVQQPLRRIGNLWYLPDESLYVYYEVIFWRYLEDE